jgi:hypothetical protein
LSFWADQLEQDRIGRYRATYRREPDLFNLKHA